MNMTDVAALHARIAQLERAQARRGQSRRRAWLLAALCTGLLLALTPLGLLAGNNQQFADVDPNSVHAPNIVAIRQAGITTGCNPGANLYCPNNYVRRDEMASFLARTAGIGTNPPVVNALTAVSAQSATNAGHASSADTATTAQHAASADNATNASHATNADTATNATNATTAASASTVGGYAPNGLVRVVQNNSVSGGPISNDCNTPTALLTVSLMAPGAGFVLVNGDTIVFGNGGTGPAGAFLRARHQGDTATPPPFTLTYIGTTEAREETAAVTWVFPVSGAGTQTFVLEACRAPTASTLAINYGYPVISALYVPFGANGTGP